jgi:hypothetical protein
MIAQESVDSSGAPVVTKGYLWGLDISGTRGGAGGIGLFRRLA